MYWLRGWGRNATPDELELLFEALLTETVPARLIDLLRCFRYAGLPRFDPRLKGLLTHPDADVASNVLSALSTLRDPEVHAIAREHLAAGELIDGLTLFESKSDDDDLEVIRSLLVPPTDPDDSHHLGDLLLRVLENSDSRPGDLLMVVYEQTPCTWCRRRAVELMIAHDVLPESIREECRFDACSDIRRLVGAS